MPNNAENIEDFIITELSNRFDGKVENFVISGSTDIPYTMTSIVCKMYKYFYIRFNYDRGRFGCSIINGEYGVSIESSEKWFDEADFDKFFKDLQEQIELRIPDKFLEYYGWK
ncbi:hypothetical protein [Cohnella panacarvi]|uniref:hypothetical protein n=1 Tax=Cohnella panacarvi TaxID=400776 RepID=UPI0004796B97|nr:hypothetical protein [Cohnella panacarvi]